MGIIEGCGLSFSACNPCISSGRILSRIEGNFTFCCNYNPATLEEAVIATYSKLSDCPADMTSTYILAGSIVGVGALIGFLILGYCIVNCIRHRRQGYPVRFPRARYLHEMEPLITVARDYGVPNYGMEPSPYGSHVAAARALGSVHNVSSASVPLSVSRSVQSLPSHWMTDAKTEAKFCKQQVMKAECKKRQGEPSVAVVDVHEAL